MSEFKQRLLQILEAEGMSKSEYSRQMGLSTAYVGSMRKSMPMEKLERTLEIFPGIRREWLLFGTGPMYKSAEPSRKLVPLLPDGAMAGPSEGFANSYRLEDCDMIASPVDDADLAIRVVGDSMEPRIHNLSILFVKKVNENSAIPWGKAVLVDSAQGAFVKVLMPSTTDPEMIVAQSYNPRHEPFDIPRDTIHGIYRICAQVIEGDYC